MSQLFASGGQSIGVSASTSVLSMNTQDWSPLGWLVGSPYSPRDSQESSLTPQFKSFNFLALSFLYVPTLYEVCLFVCLSLYWDVKLCKWGDHERKTETQTKKSCRGRNLSLVYSLQYFWSKNGCFFLLVLGILQRVYLFLKVKSFHCVLVEGNSWRRQWHPTPVLLPGKSHRRRSLVGCSPWGC